MVPSSISINKNQRESENKGGGTFGGIFSFFDGYISEVPSNRQQGIIIMKLTDAKVKAAQLESGKKIQKVAVFFTAKASLKHFLVSLEGPLDKC